MERAGGISWWSAVGVAFMLAAGGLFVSAGRLAGKGVGLLGVNNDVPWGWDIVQFVFWIGIGHAGTLISSALLLTNQGWRTPVARTAELMTLCAVACAAVFPVAHVGRLWMAWLAAPAPVASGVWPDAGSALMWDVLAVSTYFLISLLYWFIGMTPDCAVMRDMCRSSLLRRLFACVSLGWRGSRSQWQIYRGASVALSFVLTPLVVTVHSIVSMDFASTIRTGWHETFFPPFFVSGAVLSGMAMVQLLTAFSKRQDQLGSQHMLARYVLGFSWLMAFFYGMEILCAHLRGGRSLELIESRLWGERAWWFWLMVIGNVALPQLYWLRRWRSRRLVILVVSLGVLVGMWWERVVIVVGASLCPVIPGREPEYVPTAVDGWMMAGSAGLFAMLFMLGSRLMPPEFESLRPRLPRADAWRGWIPMLGAVCGALGLALWVWNTQQAVTVAVVQGHLPGWSRWASFVPALFVSALLGAGIAVSVAFFFLLRRTRYGGSGGKT